MDVQNTIGGSLQISTDVLVKIARLAALEVGGVAEAVSYTHLDVYKRQGGAFRQHGSAAKCLRGADV